MTPLLSVIYFNTSSKLDVVDVVEYIGINYIGSESDINILISALRIAKGKYVMILRDGDIPKKDMLKHVLSGIGGNRDIVLFNAENENGDKFRFSVASRKHRLSTSNTLLTPMHFHAVRRQLITSVIGQAGSETDAFIRYSNRIGRICFTEHNIDKVLITTSNV